MKKLLIPFVLFGSVVFAEAKSPAPKSMEVAFLCVSPPNPTKYKVDKDGLYRTVLENPKTLPPSVIYYKSGKNYEPVQLNTNSLTSPKKIVGDKDGQPSEFYLKDETPSPEDKNHGDKWKPFVSLGNVDDASSRLVCMSKANGSQSWSPPQVRVIDISTAKFPEASVLLINLTSAPILAQIGATGRPARLEAGKTIVMPANKDAEGTVLIKIARESSGGMEIISNTGKILDAGKRGVLLVYDANKSYAGRAVDILFQQITTGPEASTPPPEEKTAKKINGRR